MKSKEFLTELRDLLAKHNASISFDCDEDSDLHGIFGERMVVTVGGVDTVVSNLSWSIDSKDCQFFLDSSKC